MAGLNETPGGERLHIGFFGRRNSGKSSLVNALTGHSTALVSDVAGTTTDPVYKSMEIHGIGPCSIIDTAGYDDEGDLGSLRVERTSDAAKKTDVAVLVLGPDDISDDMAEKWAAWFKKHRIPVVLVMNKADTAQDAEKAAARISEHIGVEAIVMSARTGEGVDELKRAIIRAVPEDWGGRSVTGGLASCGMSGADITITGDFSIYFQEPWHPLFGGVYGMFTSGFEGAYLFHSVPYEIYRHDALEAAEFNKLGQNASQGCVRMMVSDVYWVWKNCPLYTPVHVIDADSSADPLGKPRTVKLPANAVWDPTDKTEGNPYLDKVPTLTCAEDVEVSTGTQVDPMEGVSATDMFGNDVTDRVVVAGEVLRDKPGTYYLTYSFTDEFHRKTTATRTVTVVEK